MKLLLSTGLFLFIIFTVVRAQHGFVLHQMTPSIPQANFLNPAFTPESKVQVGIPAMSHHHLFLKNPFSLNDIVSRDAHDSLTIDTDKLLAHLDRTNRLSAQNRSTLLFAGLHLLDGYLTFSFDLNMDVKLSYPREWMELMIKGNGNPEIIGDKILIDRFAFSAFSYSRTSLSYSRPLMDNKLKLGFRASILKGFINLEVDRRSGGYFRTDPETYELEMEMEDIQLNSSGFGMFEDNKNFGQLFFTNNYGFSFDMGAVWEPVKDHTVSFSLIDAGFIRWNYDTKNYRIKDGRYSFDGINLEEIDSFEEVLDSLSGIFDPLEFSESYRTGLDPGLYLGYRFEFKKIHTFSFLHHSIFFRDDYSHGFSLGYGIRPVKLIHANIAYTFINQHPANLGLGVSFNPGPVNLYLISDNISFLFKPANAHLADLRLGLNLVFR